MGKNIVLCLDGTSNEYGDTNTNVVKLYSVLPKESPDQIAFYDPGVGTFSAPAALTQTVKKISRLFGLAFGYGITQNVADAYRFLMQTWEPGDQVYIFGFSRGAYTARAVAAMLYKCGLLERHNESLLPYALKLFKYVKDKKLYIGFRETFSRRCRVRFLGVWDTVKTVGWIYDPVTLQFTRRNPIVDTVRHAMAIDERRCFYRQNLWGEPYAGQDVRQVWFTGVHCDVGGGYPEAECGLSKIPLEWMVGEARAHGMLVDEERLAALLGRSASPPDGAEEPLTPPDPLADPHRSLKGIWWIAEGIPKRYQNPKKNWEPSWTIPRGKRRFIAEGSTVHRSVVERREALAGTPKAYDPPNLPASHQVEPAA